MNTSNLNEINAADADAGYGARGVPAFLCRFVSKDRLKVAEVCRIPQKSGKDCLNEIGFSREHGLNKQKSQ